MHATKHVFTVQCIFQIVDYGATILRMINEYPISVSFTEIQCFKETCRSKMGCAEAKWCLFNMQIEPIQFNRDESIYIGHLFMFLALSLNRNLYTIHASRILESLLCVCALCKCVLYFICRCQPMQICCLFTAFDTLKIFV